MRCFLFDINKVVNAINKAMIHVDGSLYETETAEEIADIIAREGKDMTVEQYTAILSQKNIKFYTCDAVSIAKAIGLDENKVKVLAKAGEKVTGFDYVKALAIETGVKVPSGLKDLELKPVVHNNVCEKTEMPEVVLGAL